MNLPNVITFTWGIEDVQEVRPDLTDAQARQILSELEGDYDANVGINWRILEDYADMLFPTPDELGKEA